jgi:UDP-glucose 4-epimerase
LDFYCALKREPRKLQVLGDGTQEKSYLYVHDCLEAIFTLIDHHSDDPGVHIYNLGTSETTIVDRSANIIAEYLGVRPEIEHSGGKRGWPGDSPLILLDTTRLRSLGWLPKLTIEQAIIRTLEWFDANEYVWRDCVTES